MPRTKPATASNEPKKRSRTGCHGCKTRKVKCDEGKPRCSNCVKVNEECDYSLKLQWGGRSKKEQNAFSAMADAAPTFSSITFTAATVLPPSQPPSMPGTRDCTHEMAYLDNSNRIDPRLALIDQTTTASYSPGPSSVNSDPSSSSSLPQFALPYPYHSPQGHQYYQSSSLARPALPYEFSWSTEDRSKRARLSSVEASSRNLPPLFSPTGPSSLTPGQSSTHTSPVSTRLSVNYLLSGPAGHDDSPRPSNKNAKVDQEGFTLYGYDCGLPDLDMPKNDDLGAINPEPPAVSTQSPSNLWSPSQLYETPLQPERPAFEKGGYYARPVAILIPNELEPLPAQLSNSPMDLIYFHHFLNHTARILVPHDCPDNPMKTTLPRIAVQDSNLLNLLLAYSASHRARLLSHPEPANRIATWLRDVFPDLRRSLSSDEPVSNATLTTAIMLASRECINPDSLDVPIPWQTHLEIARGIIISRGGLKDKGDAGDAFVNFLAKWFAYLDVIGSLSSHRNPAPLEDRYMLFDQRENTSTTTDADADAHDFTIDCFFGFTNCCIGLLARVARLARECGAERIDQNNNLDVNWRPSAHMRELANALKQELSNSRHHAQKVCRHSRRSNNNKENETEDDDKRTQAELQEMVSVNESYHLAGLIHLNRRVLGMESTHPEIQGAVKLVLQALEGVRRGGTAESSLLFPMFTAGCEAQDEEDREMILERLKVVEGLGMTCVRSARHLMERAWATGKSWEVLVAGEFLG